MAEPIDIAGSVSVVTGGASGIGKGIVKALFSASSRDPDGRVRCYSSTEW